MDKFSAVLKAVLGDSWKTTVTGFVTALVIAIYPIVQAGRLPTGHEVLLAAMVVVGGRLVKDHNVTGDGK